MRTRNRRAEARRRAGRFPAGGARQAGGPGSTEWFRRSNGCFRLKRRALCRTAHSVGFRHAAGLHWARRPRPFPMFRTGPRSIALLLPGARSVPPTIWKAGHENLRQAPAEDEVRALLPNYTGVILFRRSSRPSRLPGERAYDIARESTRNHHEVEIARPRHRGPMKPAGPSLRSRRARTCVRSSGS